MNNQRVERLLNRLAGLLIPIGIGLSAVAASIYNIPAGHRAVIFDRLAGVKQQVISEGTHFIIPWLQRPIIFDVRIQPRSISATTGSKDMQRVSLTLRVLHKPHINSLAAIYSKLGLDYADRVLPSIGNEVLKSIVAQFDASELITQRELVSQKIREDLIKRSEEFHILLEDVSITHLTFGQEFTDAVEKKQVAQQEAERAKYIVEKAEQEKVASIIRAEGEAQAAEMISKAISNSGTGMIELRRIEAAKEIASTLASSKNVTYLPTGGKQTSGSGSFLLQIGAQKHA